MTLQDALVIDGNRSININSTTDPHQLLFLMLEKIKMSDHNCKKLMLYDANNNEDDDDEETAEILVHPMDSLLVLIHCSNDFLRQDLYLKLNTSQLAVPLLLPDPVSKTLTLPLWSLRSVVKYWKSKASNDETTYISNEGRIVDCSLPLISFMRFNHPGNYSKSKILNNVISNSKHDFFFNYECEGSSVKREFVDGVVEVCWYLPSGEKSDLFSDAIAFANLRGNAGDHEQQLAFLSCYSYMSFLFLTEKDIETYSEKICKLKSTKGKTLFLMNTCSKSSEARLKLLVSDCVIIKLSNKEPAAIVKSIQSKITSSLSKTRSPFYQISKSSTCSEFVIIIDEDNVQHCQAGKKLAMKIMDVIKDIPPADVKGQMVPLQGPHLWHKWASLDKQQNRMKSDEMGYISLEEYHADKRKQKAKIRKDQVENTKKRSCVMKIFIDVLLKKPKEVRFYFLEWLKIYLDDRSRKVLPDLQKRCKITREKLRATSKTEVEKIRQELKKHDEELIYASFGVEHLFRELGQMYEAVMELKGNIEQSMVEEAERLSEVATDLLLSGYPLELIDGDAAHIPQLWVTALLKNVKKHIKDARMAVLSVLGIQSTGKSTLMNTLFGIRSAVSAGRCTRGAYFQLIKVNSDPSDKATCKYLLVIDTEGLRAPELDSQQTQRHDNELATLVIGLAGVTIINMFGEVPADINDILQTTVHAFLRLKNVELKPSCQFVRHHVASVTASQSNEGSQRFQRTLDEMTVLATKAEHCEGQYEHFDDVIVFNNETDVQNFPSLWEGNPPMAPVNPAYCEAAQKLKSKFIGLSQSPDFLCSIDEFKERVKKLWKAVLSENFLFSFKNTLEIEAFAKLNAEYSKWSWRLQHLMLNWEQSTEKIITPAAIRNIENNETEQVRKIITDLNVEYACILEDLKSFFENPNSTLVSIMAQWRTRYERKLQELKDYHVDRASRFCKDLIQKSNAMNKVEEMKKNERKRIDQQIKALVSEVNITKDRKLTAHELDELQKKFDQQWEKWMVKIKLEYPPLKQLDLNTVILQCLRIKCQLTSHDRLIVSKVTEIPLNQRGQPLRLVINQQKHINMAKMQKVKNYLGSFFTEQAEVITETKTKELLEDVKVYFSQNDLSYKDAHIIRIVQIIMERIQKVENEVNFQLTNEYRIDLILEVAGYALKVFTRIQKQAIDNHPITYLASLRSLYNTQFKALCTATQGCSN